MVQKTSIEWTDRSANPFRARHKLTGKVGWHCVVHGPGCLHCYSAVFNKRFGTKLPFSASSTSQVECFLDERVLRALLKVRKTERIFLCDMTDIFGDWVEEEWLDKVFSTIAMCRNLTFQVLTKRPERMLAYLRQVSDERDMQRWANHACELTQSPCAEGIFDELDWPLPNLWLGVSVEDRKHGLPRVDELRKVPAAVRFLSVEPLIEDLGEINLEGIDWVIVGGESGHGARPMHPAWLVSLLVQCKAAGVPFFFKQWGEWLPEGQGMPHLKDVIGGRGAHESRALFPDGRHLPDLTGCGTNGDNAIRVFRVGKKRAGRLLDGRTWDELPRTAEAVSR